MMDKHTYGIRGLGDPLSGKVGAEGAVSFEARVSAHEVTLPLTERVLLFPVRLGDLDPLEEPSGVRMRVAQGPPQRGLERGLARSRSRGRPARSATWRFVASGGRAGRRQCARSASACVDLGVGEGRAESQGSDGPPPP
jgi:hypothetical protein